MQHKICRICEKIKNIEDFHKKKNTSDGHRNECKECVKELQKKYKSDPNFKDKQKEYDKKRYQEKREKILERKKEYHQENKEKILSYKKVYRKQNENKIKSYLDNYRQEHRQEMRDYIKRYRVENREKYYKYRRENPHIIAWRSVLYSTLKRLNTSKQGHTIDILGYSALDLKNHIESQFQSGMTWLNYGEWEIDHIKPVTKFPNDASIKEVCALDNLQPLWWYENLTKLNKFSQ